MDSNDKLDQQVLDFINLYNNKDNQKIPEPSKYTISTQSAMCNISCKGELNLSKIVIFVAKNIINNIIFKKNLEFLIRGIVVDDLIIRFDDTYLKKYKKPLIKYMGKLIDFKNHNDCLLMLGNLQLLENNSLKKNCRKKKNKADETFYNSCSIITKGGLKIKCINIKLFNNGKITLTGSKHEMDGYKACCVLLDYLKNEKDIFIEDENENEISNLKIENYKITMINSDFNTNFKIDLLKLLNILNTTDKNIFTKFNPEKYRGLIIGYFWNTNKKIQDGKCNCTKKCNGKGTGTGDGQCKKITISIFKSGSIIITGGRLIEQVNDAYKNINSILKKHYFEIIKLSILDFIEEDNDEIAKLENNIFVKSEKNINNSEIKKIKIKKITN